MWDEISDDGTATKACVYINEEKKIDIDVRPKRSVVSGSYAFYFHSITEILRNPLPWFNEIIIQKDKFYNAWNKLGPFEPSIVKYIFVKS